MIEYRGVHGISDAQCVSQDGQVRYINKVTAKLSDGTELTYSMYHDSSESCANSQI